MHMARLRLDVPALLRGVSAPAALNNVNLGGLCLLVIGAGMGFFADTLCAWLSPDAPDRANLYRIIGLALAFAGAFWAIHSNS
jgi:hypothetical protein